MSFYLNKAKSSKYNRLKGVVSAQCSIPNPIDMTNDRLAFKKKVISSSPNNNIFTITVTVMFLTILAFTGCQTQQGITGVEKATYQTTTQPIDNKNYSKDQVAQVRTSLAAQYIRKNQLDAAQRQLQKAFAADKSYAPAYDMMGVLLQQEGSRINLSKADAYFKQAIKLDPQFMQARNNYGVYLSQMKRYKEAVHQFEIAGAALGYEGRIGALENLGRTLLKLDNKPAATKAFVRALEGNQNSLIAHVELVDLLLDAGSYIKAQQMYDEMLLLIGRQPLSPRFMLQGIKLAHVMQQADKQQELAQQLLSSYPLSNEAKQLRTWLNNPEATWK